MALAYFSQKLHGGPKIFFRILPKGLLRVEYLWDRLRNFRQLKTPSFSSPVSIDQENFFIKNEPLKDLLDLVTAMKHLRNIVYHLYLYVYFVFLKQVFISAIQLKYLENINVLVIVRNSLKFLICFYFHQHIYVLHNNPISRFFINNTK